MAIICFQVSKTAKEKIMRDAGSNVISGVKKRKTKRKGSVSAKRKKR